MIDHIDIELLYFVLQVEEVEVMVADTSGENVDNKTRLEVLKKREQLIQEEEEEKKKEVHAHH